MNGEASVKIEFLCENICSDLLYACSIKVLVWEDDGLVSPQL